MDVSQLNPHLQKKAKELDNLAEAYGYELNINHMSKNEVQFILDIMSNYWFQMDGNRDIQNEVHRVANLLRKTAGIAEG